MKKMKLLIKGMVCNRCIIIVSNELRNLGYIIENTSLGEMHIQSEKKIDMSQLEERLSILGFGLVQDQKDKITQEVKRMIANVYSGNFDFPLDFRFTDLIKIKWKNYRMVSDAFMTKEKTTLEHYIINYRLNKAKEYLVYTNDTLEDIAFKLNFYSVPHLSSQFKKRIGLSPSHFRTIKKERQVLINRQL